MHWTVIIIENDFILEVRYNRKEKSNHADDDFPRTIAEFLDMGDRRN